MRSLAHIGVPERGAPLTLVWPSPADAASVLRFDRVDDWRTFVEALGVEPRIPDVVRSKFVRAQTLYLLAWIDATLIKAGELAALIALECAVTDRYAAKVPKGARGFAALLRYMVATDGVTDRDLPVVARCGGTAVGQLTGDVRPTLADRRNSLAHGDPFDGLPTAGLLELVRDLIHFAYRGYVAEAAGSPA